MLVTVDRHHLEPSRKSSLTSFWVEHAGNAVHSLESLAVVPRWCSDHLERVHRQHHGLPALTIYGASQAALRSFARTWGRNSKIKGSGQTSRAMADRNVVDAGSAGAIPRAFQSAGAGRAARAHGGDRFRGLVSGHQHFCERHRTLCGRRSCADLSSCTSNLRASSQRSHITRTMHTPGVRDR